MKVAIMVMLLLILPMGLALNENCEEGCIHEQLTCQEALAQGLLTGTIVNGTAVVTNNASTPFTISLASYEMYAALTEDQVLYDADTQLVEQNATFNVSIPDCAHQVDLVCGEPLPYSPLYGALVLDFAFGNQESYCTPQEREENVSVAVRVKDHYPQGGDYVFECEAEGFQPTSYYWYFGDGDIQPASNNTDVFHTYTQNGDYMVACTATDGTRWQTDTLDITVDSYGLEVSVADHYPKGLHYIFRCDAEGFSPEGYDWDFGDGEKLYDQNASDVYHVFEEEGDYQVTCSASEGETFMSAWTTVTVSEPIVSVSIKDPYPKGNEYVFECQAEGFNPDAYDWNFGDGEKLYDNFEENVFHTYKENGDYTVTCAARDENSYAVGVLQVAVDACEQFVITIIDVEQEEGSLQARGTLTEDGKEASGVPISVNDEVTGALMGLWTIIIPEAESIEATVTNTCGQEFTALLSEGELGFNEPFELTSEQIFQPLQQRGSGSSCWPGFHEEGEICVKDEVKGDVFEGVDENPSEETSPMAVTAAQEETLEGEGPTSDEVPKYWTMALLILTLLAAFFVSRQR